MDPQRPGNGLIEVTAVPVCRQPGGPELVAGTATVLGTLPAGSRVQITCHSSGGWATLELRLMVETSARIDIPLPEDGRVLRIINARPFQWWDILGDPAAELPDEIAAGNTGAVAPSGLPTPSICEVCRRPIVAAQLIHLRIDAAGTGGWVHHGC